MVGGGRIRRWGTGFGLAVLLAGAAGSGAVLGSGLGRTDPVRVVPRSTPGPGDTVDPRCLLEPDFPGPEARLPANTQVSQIMVCSQDEVWISDTVSKVYAVEQRNADGWADQVVTALKIPDPPDPARSEDCPGDDLLTPVLWVRTGDGRWLQPHLPNNYCGMVSQVHDALEATPMRTTGRQYLKQLEHDPLPSPGSG